MQNSLWKKSYANYYSAGSCGRKALLAVSNHSIGELNVRACRRNNLEAMGQLALMCALN
jgi:hypothetical protein